MTFNTEAADTLLIQVFKFITGLRQQDNCGACFGLQVRTFCSSMFSTCMFVRVCQSALGIMQSFENRYMTIRSGKKEKKKNSTTEANECV